jgi:glycosyltransferase involved in cell wall biosynthesis
MLELKYFVGNYKLHKTHLIPNSILSVENSIPDKEKRILWLSRLSYKQKRADLILPFWKKVVDKLPEWQLDIVGSGNAYEDIKYQIELENIPRVTLYGRQEPYKYYKRAAIYIMTSAYEGLPNTILEAQSFACIPIVYDNYPICSWVVNEGESGILIPPFDVDKMAQETVLLAKDSNRQTVLMEAALTNAREFQLDKVGKKWIQFFDENKNIIS